jgi:SAM-dependent methyltransferase
MPSAEQAASGWQLREDSAEAYERVLARAFQPWADRLLELAGVAPGERVLDVACGTGVVARRAAMKVGAAGTVTALDLSEGMLAVGRRVTAGVRPAIDWRQGDAAALPFADASFDVVLCHQAIGFFADRPAAVREMRRVLTAGGRAAISLCRPVRYSPAYVPLADLLQRHLGGSAGEVMRSPFPSWNLEDLRAILASAAWPDLHIRIVVESLRYPSAEEFLLQETASSPLAAPVRALPVDSRRTLVRDLEAALEGYVDDDGIVFPLETWVALARR